MAGSSSGEGTPAAEVPAAALEALLIQYLSRAESEGEDALEALCREHPQQSDALRRAASALHGFGLAGATERDVPDVLGDFRVLERLGQGGMGVVHLAEQISLGRRVALKLIRPDQAYFGGARERFRREIEAVARLSHPGIVAIYQVGEQRGIPYFAMEHVVGASLADVLRALSGRDPALLRGRDLAETLAVGSGEDSSSSGDVRIFRESWVRAVIAIGRQVAEALEHAHQRGVFHRDVKPSNVLLSPRGRAALVDFGLATLQGADALTKTGSQIGSLPYMPPERIAGRPGDPALEDVYALGVTLYEMLALSPAFLEEEAPATLQKILDANPPSLRSKNRAVPPDVEVVIKKAIDPDPAQRYATAAAFARDLGNILDLRPIEARGASARLRLVRAVQRHPAWAVALLAAGLAVVVGPLVFALQQRSKLDAIREERDRTAAERERAEANLEKAISAVDLMLAKVGGETLREVPQMEGLRKELLEGALTLYEELLADQSWSGRVRGRLVHTQDRVAALHEELGHFAEAERILREELEEVEKLLADPDETRTEVRQARPLTRNRLANVLRRSGRIDEAAALYAQSIVELEPLCAERPDSLELVRELGLVHYNVALLEKSQQRLPEASAHLDQALALDREVQRRGTGTFEERKSFALTLIEKGVLDVANNRIEEALGSFDEALPILARLCEERPHSAILAQIRVKAGLELGTALAKLSRPDEAQARLEAAHAAGVVLVGEHPDIALNRNLLASIEATLGEMHGDAGRAAESETWMRAAYGSFRENAARHPESPEYLANQAHCAAMLGKARGAAGDREQALRLLREAVELDHRAIAKAPKHRALQKLLCEHREALALELFEEGASEEALDIARELASEAAPATDGLVASARLWAREASLRSERSAEDPGVLEAARAAVRDLETALARGWRPDTELARDPRFEELAELLPGFAELAARASKR